MLVAVMMFSGMLFIGCDTFIGNMLGETTENSKPIVEFANVPAPGDTFNYAPVIYWKGRDADGFVEAYYYADITDSTALDDPEYFTNFIPEEAWIRTEASSDTVYLLTERGKVTKHVFYLKCVDDRGVESDIIHREFYRTNLPPNVPHIKLSTDSDEAFANDVVIEDTMFVLDRVTDTWSGIGFVWKSSDPDDRDLYRIPLQYRYYLVKTPHDTIWQWVSSDWVSRQEINTYGLETGHYIFTVWARDDGFELSERPASITFDVYKPTFEQSILLLNTSVVNPNASPGRGDAVPGDQYEMFYRQMTTEAGFTDYEYFQFPRDGDELYRSYLGRFRLVIWFSESRNTTNPNFESLIRQYVRVGGRLWVVGAFTRNNMITNNTTGLMESTFAGPPAGVSRNLSPSEWEFKGANAGVRDMPDVAVDSTRLREVYNIFLNARPEKFPLLPGVDIMTTGMGAQTVYYYQSSLLDSTGIVTGDSARVVVNVDTIYYPPTPIDCMVRLYQKRVLKVNRVFNYTRNIEGEVKSVTNNVGQNRVSVARVSYPYGEPWAVSDSIIVDYEYQPFSDFHLKPCAIRYERLFKPTQSSAEVRYRVAVFGFPLYFIDNSDGAVTKLFNNMLNWFFWPVAH